MSDPLETTLGAVIGYICAEFSHFSLFLQKICNLQNFTCGTEIKSRRVARVMKILQNIAYYVTTPGGSSWSNQFFFREVSESKDVTFL